MDNTTRLQYLSAMGIDVWRARNFEVSLEVSGDAVLLTDNWQTLQADVETCQQCDLCHSRERVVFGVGDLQADFLWVTEAPNLSDEQQSGALTDHSSELFTEMLRAMNLRREQVFITHIVKCRPTDDRDPRVKELQACEAYLQRQIALVQPKIIITVGRIAAQAMLHNKAPLAELRASTHEFMGIPLLNLYHPAYLLRSLTEKSKVWQDMQRILTLFEQVK